MPRTILSLVFLFLLQPCHAQNLPDKRLGWKVDKVPEVLYAQVPQLKEGQGVLVVQILPDTPAARAGLRRHDILLSVDGTALKGGKPLTVLFGKVSEARPVDLVVLRGGKKVIVPFPKPSGPVALLKPDGPPAVSVEAKPLAGNQLVVTFTFYARGSGKLEKLTCNGSLEEIKQKVKEQGPHQGMSARIQDLADLTLERLRIINAANKK